MTSPDDRVACGGCGALVPNLDGPTHRYIGASAGCWAIYGEVLAREYGDVRYARLHQITVDTYAAQHPGFPSPQSVQSVAVHLVGLYAVFELGRPPQAATSLIQRAARRKRQFVWLDPPESLGSLTILDVHRAKDPSGHVERVRAWGQSVWSAWAPHHATVRLWAQP